VTRRYLLAGLLACGRCGRRLESAWSNGKPAYQCRHGYTTAARPDPERPKNTYLREDRVLPHLAAIAILLGRDLEPSSGTAQIAAPDETAVHGQTPCPPCCICPDLPLGASRGVRCLPARCAGLGSGCGR